MLLEGYNFFLNLDLEIMSENYWLLLREVFIGSCPSICLQMSENLSVGGFLQEAIPCMLEGLGLP